jgi:hypothetical protein
MKIFPKSFRPKRSLVKSIPGDEGAALVSLQHHLEVLHRRQLLQVVDFADPA